MIFYSSDMAGEHIHILSLSPGILRIYATISLPWGYPKPYFYLSLHKHSLAPAGILQKGSSHRPWVLKIRVPYSLFDLLKKKCKDSK